jgi:hypothetical protein
MKFGFLPLVFLVGCASPDRNPDKLSGKHGWGEFSGPIKTEWLSGDRMRLLEDAIYTGHDGYEWKVKAGDVIDGASIPQVFRSLVGGRYDGDYKFASVFHDVYCGNRVKPWRDVHYMFYTGMRAKGMSDKKAKLMFYAVWKFGPRWNKLKIPIPTPDPTAAEAKKIQTTIDKTNPSVETIQKP